MSLFKFGKKIMLEFTETGVVVSMEGFEVFDELSKKEMLLLSKILLSKYIEQEVEKNERK